MFLNWQNKQKFALRLLTSHLKLKRLSHAYLFTGDSLCGKEALARAFAASILCHQEKYFETCSCESCHKMKQDVHPDFHLLGDDPKSKSIKIAEVREIIQIAALKPFEGNWKVFLVPAADRLTADASNAFLKTLEEPPARSIFILMTENRSNMIETIQSRCFELRFRPGNASMEMPAWDLKKTRSWTSLLEGFQDKTRVEALTQLDDLAKAIRMELESNPSFAYVQAIDKIFETKDALDQNVNQKLAITYLQIQMEKYAPLGIS